MPFLLIFSLLGSVDFFLSSPWSLSSFTSHPQFIFTTWFSFNTSVCVRICCNLCQIIAMNRQEPHWIYPEELRVNNNLSNICPMCYLMLQLVNSLNHKAHVYFIWARVWTLYFFYLFTYFNFGLNGLYAESWGEITISDYYITLKKIKMANFVLHFYKDTC